MSFNAGDRLRLDPYYDSFRKLLRRITFVAASGDSGAPGGYPAYSPDVVAVGGTSLIAQWRQLWQRRRAGAEAAAESARSNRSPLISRGW